jgi:protein SCO1/2
MDHSSFAYLMDRDGKYLTHFAPGTSAEEMAAAIAKYL